MANVELCGVSKVYPGGARALDEVDLQARDGEILVLLGANGSGKTTLLRLIAGLERPSSGVIRIGGHAVDGVPPRRRRVAMIFQGCVLYPHLTAEQNILFGLEPRCGKWIGNRLANLFGISDNSWSESREQVRRTAKLLGIERLLDRYPRQLSGGERQRVAIGRALVRQPAVFLLDEPWSNVDMRLRRQLQGELRRWRAQMGGSMILVTHDDSEALAVGDRVAVLDNGRLRGVGTPAEMVAAREVSE
jgi:ABC-type sugar transport system ATPase subunit